MNEEQQKPTPGELTGDGLGDATETAFETADEAPAEAAEQTLAALAQELDKARAEVAELNSRVLRVQADYENYRRRVQREKEDLAVYANQKLLLNLLPVLDNLERALATAPAQGDEKLRQGVELTARSFRDILGKEGVTPIEAVGQQFDPNLHEAVMTVESGDHEDGTILMELQKGYRLGERVIRPTMAQVVKNG